MTRRKRVTESLMNCNDVIEISASFERVFEKFTLDKVRLRCIWREEILTHDALNMSNRFCGLLTFDNYIIIRPFHKAIINV